MAKQSSSLSDDSKADKELAKSNKGSEPPLELTDDTEIIGPGQLLSDAREKMGLTVEQVAKQLNFRIALVKEIEQDHYDRALPSTFNRGYLRNYAKLVGVSEKDVLSSYDMLGVAEKQGAEMQSFSKITRKQAEHSRLKWFTYLIFILLIASTVLWFFQENGAAKLSQLSSFTADEANLADNTSIVEQQASAAQAPTQVSAQESIAPIDVSQTQETVELSSATPSNLTADQESLEVQQIAYENSPLNQVSIQSPIGSNKPSEQLSESLSQPLNDGNQQTGQVVDLEFTFAGDCWVNIYDASGERLAWGIKKADYVMTVSGLAPFNVTLGKPELVEIKFAGQAQDMSQFGSGNIAKFTLPFSS